MALSPPPTHYGGHGALSAMALTQQPSPLSPSSYSHNGLHSPSKSLSPTGYDYTVRGGSNGNGCLSGCPPQSPTLSPQSASLHSPPHGGMSSAYMSGALPNINGLGPLSPHAVSPHHNVSPTPPPMGVSIMSGSMASRDMLPSSPSPPTSVSALTRDAMINSLSANMNMGAMGLAGHSQSHHLVSHPRAHPHGHLHGHGHHGGAGGGGGGGGASSSLNVGKNSPPSSVSTSSPSGNNSGGGSASGGPGGASSNGGELEEINTKELAARISAELKRYSIPQAIFAQRVLCRSQGTLSDLLRNPKPWSKLKSGRETFRRMWKWLQEPEFQRMSALRLAGKSQYIFSGKAATLPHVTDTSARVKSRSDVLSSVFSLLGLSCCLVFFSVGRARSFFLVQLSVAPL